MLQVFGIILPGLVIGLLKFWLVTENKNFLSCLKDTLFYTVVTAILSLGSLKFIFNKPNVFVSQVYTLSFVSKYFVYGFLVGLGVLLLILVLESKLRFKAVPVKKVWLDRLLKGLSVFFALIGGLAFFFSRWFIDYFGEITPEQFLFNLNSPLKGTAGGMYTEIFQTPLFAALFIMTPILLLLVYNRYDINLVVGDTEKIIFSRVAWRTLLFVMTLLLFVGGLFYGAKKLKINEVYQAYAADSPYVEQNYVKPTADTYEFPEKKRNLIHIYLESVENSFFSKDLGGHMEVNLMPELAELAKEGVHFSETEKMGGPYQTYGSSWSVASMINMGMGIPLKVPMGGNSYGKSGYFLPGARGIGDILADEGYEQTIMFGADADFGGLTTYFTDHGNFNIFDVKHARAEGLIPADYDVWWGYEDDKLYEFAKDEISRLAETGKPFNFTMETADTHFPDGYLSEHAPTPHDKQYSNVIAYSTAEAVKFIRWIQAQPFYDNTTILVTGDHLSMDKKYFLDFDPNYHRTVFNLFLNSTVSPSMTTDRHFSPVDFFPSTLSSMGVTINADRLGLGTDLFSGKETLVERDGLKKFNDELGTRSNFYNREFVSEKNK